MALGAEVIGRRGLACGINLDNSSQDTAQDPSSFKTQAPDQGPDSRAECSENGLNEAAHLNTSAEGQKGEGRLAEGQSRLVRRRKYGPAGLGVSTKPDVSVDKRPRFESGTSQPVLDGREDSEMDEERGYWN